MIVKDVLDAEKLEGKGYEEDIVEMIYMRRSHEIHGEGKSTTCSYPSPFGQSTVTS